MNFNKKNFINGYLKRIKNDFELKNTDISFEILAMAAVLDRNFDVIYKNDLINNKADGGIDGIYFEEELGSITMHVFQCKNQHKLKQNDIEKFLNDVRTIFEEGKEKINSVGLKRKFEYFETQSQQKIINIKKYFIFNGDKHDKSFIDTNLITKFHEKDDFEIWDSNDLYGQIDALIRSLNKRKEVRFTFHPEKSNITSSKDYQGLITFAIYQTTGAVFKMSATELCQLLEQEKKINGTIEKIFSENIRGFLGKTNLTNAKILETLRSDDSIFFPFLNNGITIICDNIQIPQSTQVGKYIIPSVNPVIVNGLQTTYLIYKQYLENKESIQDVSVTVKLCETSDETLIEKITDATNTQSVITFKDKLSNKKFNQYAKEFFKTIGIAYISKRGEIFGTIQENLTKTVQAVDLLKSWYSTFYEQPQEANTTPQIIYKEIFEASIRKNSKLYPLFGGHKDSVLYGQLLLVYYIRESVEKEVNKLIETIVYNDIIQKMYYLTYERMYFMVYKILKEQTNNFEKVSLNKIQNAVTQTFNIIDFHNLTSTIYKDGLAQILKPQYSFENEPNDENIYALCRLDDYIDIFAQKKPDVSSLKINIENI